MMPLSTDALSDALRERYVLERELGRGGMATVYLARDLKHKRQVALKVLSPELGAVLGTERFLREIETAAQLQHPHILPVFDSGEAAGRLWYTMPFVEGESLRDRVRREGQLSLAEGVRLGREIAEALQTAHDRGVIHRDVKPENVLLSHGHALVADFGIARSTGSGEGQRLTQTGLSLGTPAYMAPEQALGERELDGRADQYALGCVLYELLAGQPPYRAPTAQAVIAKHLAAPIPALRQVRPEVPASVDAAVARAMAKTPADRFPTAAAFGEALSTTSAEGPGASGPTIPITSPRSRWRSPILLFVSGLTLLAAAGLGVWVRHRRGVAEGGLQRLAVLPFENLGDSADAYFADGMTDAVRDKLTGLRGLEVVAPTSSGQYRRTAKAPAQIGRELGVRYLLVGHVQWAKAAGGASRVQVRPELIDAQSGVQRWGEPFDAALTDVFEVQADIATRVAQALNVALTPTDQQQLDRKPTQNLAAYDAYLKSQDDRLQGPERVALLERAVSLDSTFALAWAALALARQWMSSMGFTPAEEIERSKADADRALAIQPTLPEGFYALAGYYHRRGDDARAREIYTRGLEQAPQNIRLLFAVAGLDLERGQLDRALSEADRLAALDPQSFRPFEIRASALISLRRWPDALAAADRNLALDSLWTGSYFYKIWILLAQGDLAGARQVMDDGVRRIGYAQFVGQFGRLYMVQWALPDTALALLVRLPPSAMEGDTIDWGTTLSLAYSLRGDTVRMHAYADSALTVLNARLTKHPEDAQLRSHLPLVDALAGHSDQALHLLGTGPTYPDAGHNAIARPWGTLPWLGVWLDARSALEVGNGDRALSDLELLLTEPTGYTRAYFRLDRTFAPLRGNPRFERLVAGK